MAFDPDELERELRKDLETIKNYKELVARRSGSSPDSEKTRPSSTQRGLFGRPVADKPSLIGICESTLTTEWQPVDIFMAEVLKVHPGSARSAIVTSLRRLVDRGVAEKKGDRESGLAFRRKPGA